MEDIRTVTAETTDDSIAPEIEADEVLDADIQARIIELQLQYEAEWEANERMTAEDEEYSRQDEEARLCREQAMEVIRNRKARQTLLTSGSIRSWRDSMYDNFVPRKETFWEKWGNRALIVFYALLSLGFVISTIIYQETTRMM